MEFSAAGQASLAFDARAAVSRDQQQMPGAVHDLPVTYQPFKFESRRLRIDWRLLHGVDINKLVCGNACRQHPPAQICCSRATERVT